MATSAAYILLQDRGWKYSFDGVMSVAHSLSLKVQTDADSFQGTEYINNARNEPDVVTLSVVASDVNAQIENWSVQMLRSLTAIKENRMLCKVITSLRSYENMLLTDISILQDETCPCGWVGTLTFMKTESTETVQAGTDDNASTASNMGYAANVSSGRGGSVFLTILREAGIKSSTT